MQHTVALLTVALVALIDSGIQLGGRLRISSIYHKQKLNHLHIVPVW